MKPRKFCLSTTLAAAFAVLAVAFFAWIAWEQYQLDQSQERIEHIGDLLGNLDR